MIKPSMQAKAHVEILVLNDTGPTNSDPRIHDKTGNLGIKPDVMVGKQLAFSR